MTDSSTGRKAIAKNYARTIAEAITKPLMSGFDVKIDTKRIPANNRQELIVVIKKKWGN